MSQPPLLVLAALAAEWQALQRRLQGATPLPAGPWLGAMRGALGADELLVVCCGAGKVDAAAAAAHGAARWPPRAILSIGACGAVDDRLAIGDLVLGDRYLQWDLGLDPGALPVADRQLLARAQRAIAARGWPLHGGLIASGDQAVTHEPTRNELRQRFGAVAADMESAALARVAQRCGIPFLAIRAVSDAAGEHAIEELARYLQAAAERCASAVQELLRPPT
jgi:adenosylhomocysteine nucleosidase